VLVCTSVCLSVCLCWNEITHAQLLQEPAPLCVCVGGGMRSYIPNCCRIAGSNIHCLCVSVCMCVCMCVSGWLSMGMRLCTQAAQQRELCTCVWMATRKWACVFALARTRFTRFSRVLRKRPLAKKYDCSPCTYVLLRVQALCAASKC